MLLLLGTYIGEILGSTSSITMKAFVPSTQLERRFCNDILEIAPSGNLKASCNFVRSCAFQKLIDF